MFLKRFVFINWGNVPGIEFEFGPVNLFSGGNGSGKTTAADAIQTVMTAAHENLFQYNPGQDETTQRGRGGKRVRTLSSYVLGCDDGSYARLDPTDGYLVAVFSPSRDESAEPFSAMIAVRAWLDTAGNQSVARQEDARFFIVTGVELRQDQLLREDGGERHLVPLTDLQTLLIQEFGKRRVERYDHKKVYLRRLYGALRGKPDSVSEVEAVAAARAFSRFMSYKPVKSINRFVADEILEPKDLGEAIRSVSSQLKTIHGMERDAAQLVESIAILERAGAHAQSYVDGWIQLNLLDYSLAQAEYQLRQQDYLRGKARQKEGRETLAEVERRIGAAREQAAAVQHQLIGLEARRQGIDALRRKDELETKAAQLDRQLLEQVMSVLEQDRLLNANVQAARETVPVLQDTELLQALPGLSALESESLGREVIESGRASLQDLSHLLQRDIGGAVSRIQGSMDDLRRIQTAHNRWYELWHEAGGGDSQRDRVAALVQARKDRYQALVRRREEKQREIDRLGNNQVTYPPYVERALQAIRQQCPAADPSVLCDHVEVMDPRWQNAIEGYLGGARFSIIVDRDYEAQAIRIVRALPGPGAGRDNRARVIQGRKAAQDAARSGLDKQSIVHVLEFSHAVAKAYLTASYGSVLRVEDAEALTRTRRGLTPDGMGSGNYSMWRCDLPDADLVFGAVARERALAAKREELNAIEIEWNQANDRLQAGVALLRAVTALKPSSYADRLDQVRDIHRAMEENAALLDQLDLSEHADLERRLDELKDAQKTLGEEAAELNKHHGKLEKDLEDIQKQLNALSDLQEKNREQVEEKEAALADIGKLWTDLDVTARLEQADREALELDTVIAANQRREAENALHAAERKAAEAILEHNQNCRPVDAVVYSSFNGEYGAELFQAMVGVRRDIDRVHNILKNNILVEKRDQLAELKGAFNNAFVSHLCHAIYQALSEGKRRIDLLNKELRHHQFGADRETFRFAGEPVPEFRDYQRFFEEVIKSPGLGDEVSLFEAPWSDKSAKVRDRLMAMLLDDDEAHALRELERVADYRNYRRYEIYKEVPGKEPIPLSEYGTGSGGQLETPAYIIRAAAISSAFRFAEGRAHLRMVLVDEAFSKMDEARSREVIGYLTEALGLQLVFIMPTSKCGPYMDLISNEFVFAKVPSERPRGQLQTRILVDRKQCNQARIRELWETHRRLVYQQAEFDFMREFEAG